jgi:hypothetical protein
MLRTSLHGLGPYKDPVNAICAGLDINITVTSEPRKRCTQCVAGMLEVVMTIMMRGTSLVTNLLLILLLGVLASACAATPISESTGGYIDDAAITAKIKTALAQDPEIGIRVAHIHIITYKGVAQLSGFVDSDAEVTEAGSVAGQVDGVKSVQNNLIVKTQIAP